MGGRIPLPHAPSFLIAMRFRDSNRRPFLLKINLPMAKGAPCPRRQSRQESFLFFFLLHYSCPPVCGHTYRRASFFAGLRPARAATRRLNCNLENQEKLWDTTCVLRAVLKILTKKSNHGTNCASMITLKKFKNKRRHQS